MTFSFYIYILMRFLIFYIKQICYYILNVIVTLFNWEPLIAFASSLTGLVSIYLRSAITFLLWTKTYLQLVIKMCLKQAITFLLAVKVFLISFSKICIRLIKKFVYIVKPIVYKVLKRRFIILVLSILLSSLSPETLFWLGHLKKAQSDSITFAYQVWICWHEVATTGVPPVITDSTKAFVFWWLQSKIQLLLRIIKSCTADHEKCFSAIDKDTVILFICSEYNLSSIEALELYTAALVYSMNLTKPLSWIIDPSFILPTDPRARFFCEGIRVMDEIHFDIISKRNTISLTVCFALLKMWIKRISDWIS